MFVLLTESYLPGDNHSYDSVETPTNPSLPHPVTAVQIAPTRHNGDNGSRAENLAGTSVQERDVDNPLYASNSVEAEEAHYSIPGPLDSGNIYTIPSSPPGSGGGGGVPGPETGLYYSVVK